MDIPMTPPADENPLTIFSSADELRPLPKLELPEHGTRSEVAYQLVRDDAMLDGNARQNLATFVSTYMDEHADRLYSATFDKNIVDKDEYRRTAEIEQRCWKMIANLWHVPDVAKAIGTSTVGSSEAAMLAGLALKKRWAAARKAKGQSADAPNIVMSSAVQVCWEKFCVYWDVEARFVPIDDTHPTLTGDQLDAVVDENTIGVVAIMGVTYTGAYEPAKEISAALDRIQAARGLDIPVHVDGASGGMIAPFLNRDLEWDFRVDRVVSINTSGHKYGLVYPGLGWVVWRDVDLVPPELIFRVSYLGGDIPTLTLNFSRPGAQVLLQYYQFLHLGFSGYERVQRATMDVAQFLAQEIDSMDEFTLFNRQLDIPVFAWQRTDAGGAWTLADVSDRLRMTGWLVPSYPLPDNLSDRLVQRIVVRNGLGRDLADDLMEDLRGAVRDLDSGAAGRSDGGDGKRGFTH
ncbi:glutamate decarboxylase [Pseudoclavibacter terrae]|uniref:glutamate decarboxylase n=1 Tax=Pseudoclavibacter terrae TaxID=1530195 RepID=UPI0023302527|nr:glutamate decarboxylase [Pseudoclavibacter terrae]